MARRPPRPGRPPRWEQSEERRLEKLWAAGVPQAEIARELGRTEPAVQRRRMHLGLPLRFAGWTDAELAELERLHNAGLTATAIAERIGRSVESVRTRVQRAGLSTAVPSRGAVPWTAAEDRIVRRMTAHGDSRAVAEQLGRTLRAVQQRAHKLRQG